MFIKWITIQQQQQQKLLIHTTQGNLKNYVKPKKPEEKIMWHIIIPYTITICGDRNKVGGGQLVGKGQKDTFYNFI